MDVVLLFNGLGNQMSQYAFYLQKKSISGSTRFLFSKKSQKIHNGYELDNVFGIKETTGLREVILYLLFRIAAYQKYPLISKRVIWILNLIGIRVIYENDDYNFEPKYLKPSKGIKFFVGGWHSEKYFSNIKETILRSFEFKIEGLGNSNLDILNTIRSSASISVHIRRGDFLDSSNYEKFGSVCTLNYFLRAIDTMKDRLGNPHFFFFTNDYSWVKENFTESNFTVININTSVNSWKDMYLISNCSHHICSNGSFSWWSAWLDRKTEKTVIVPKHFLANTEFTDIYPESWIQLEDY
jgi:hypothetical protein